MKIQINASDLSTVLFDKINEIRTMKGDYKSSKEKNEQREKSESLLGQIAVALEQD